MRVLGIETSCDETGVAVYDSQRGLLGQQLYSQADMHALYGGVVPELASRDHVKRVLPLVRACLDEAGTTLADLDGIAYTAGPGLVGALLVGAGVACALAAGLGIAAVPVNHMEGHLLAPLLAPDPPAFPFVALLVSGGHSQIIRVAGVGDYDIIGETIDDAAGEAFDKTATLLGLPYPGGPHVEQLAGGGRPGRFRFPRPMTDRPGLDLSFSGLKTFAANTIRDNPDDPQTRADIAHAFCEAVVETLAIKCRRALRQTGYRDLIAAGGVAANTGLRERLRAVAAEAGGQVRFPAPGLCTDNGAMIAFAGALRLAGGRRDGAIQVRPRWPLGELAVPGPQGSA